MTNEIKKLIDELPKYDPHQIAKYSHERAMNGLKSKLFAREDDVIALVEKLTGWTKVEDGLPDFNGEAVLVRFKLGIVAVCIMRPANDNNDDEPEYYFEYASYGLGYVNDEAIEWKPIII